MTIDNRTVLIIDDGPKMDNSLRTFLESTGNKVALFANPHKSF